MPFLTGGYPAPDATAELIHALVSAGADALEVGIPFSDPIADGPVIAESMHAALQAGATPDRVFEAVASIRSTVDVPLIAMVSMSIVRRRGGGAFVRAALDAGFDGLIVPDADLEDLEEITAVIDEQGAAFTTLIAPDSPPSRVAKIIPHCREFVYLLTRRGLTGERSEKPVIAGPVETIRSLSPLPIAAGFGISRPEHVAAIFEGGAQGAIVGSALIRALSTALEEGSSLANAAQQFLAPLVQHVPADQ
jgi:tryptophan synthase alpha chain